MLSLQAQAGSIAEYRPRADRFAVQEIARVELQSRLRRANFQERPLSGSVSTAASVREPAPVLLSTQL